MLKTLTKTLKPKTITKTENSNLKPKLKKYLKKSYHVRPKT